jgi:SagB-type dehydrogenase family enzyme
MRVKVAEYAALFWDGGKLVWDDYLHQRQLALTADSEQVLRWFGTWRELDTASELGEHCPAIARQLLDAAVLIGEGTPAHQAEDRLLAGWRSWGPATRYYHFSARTLAGTRYMGLEEDAEAMRRKAAFQPPPSPFKNYPDRPLIPVRSGAPDDRDWTNRGLLDALYRRRSVRDFGPEGVTLAELSAILEVAAGVVERQDDPVLGTFLFKTSASAGGCQAIELYVLAPRVEGLTPGLYHFSPERSGLEDLGREASADEVRAAVGGQPWLARAPALIIFTAVIERSSWRYETRRAYRDVLIGLGHVSQTVLLTATAMGLGAVFATALGDEALERLIDCDPVAEIPLGVTALGRKNRASPAPGMSPA